MKAKLEEFLVSSASPLGISWEGAEINPADLVFSPELLAACKANVCGHYNTSWTCPPGVGTLEEQRAVILSWNRAFVFATKHDLEDSFDYEGMTRGKDIHTGLTVKIRELSGLPVFGAGSCPHCGPGSKACAYPDPCRFPDKRISSIEAAGINVTELSKTAGIRYNNGPNTVTYFSMVLYNS